MNNNLNNCSCAVRNYVLERHEADDDAGERRRQLNERPPQRVEEGDGGERGGNREHIAIADIDCGADAAKQEAKIRGTKADLKQNQPVLCLNRFRWIEKIG